MNQFSKELADAISTHEALPAFPGELTLDEAYQLQHRVTAERCGEDIGGIKAGVTSPPIQQYLGLDHALIASLYLDSLYPTVSTLPHLEGRMVECEVAVIVDAGGKPKMIAPAVEIVLVKFSIPTDMTAANLVACNLGADLYLIGEPVSWDSSFNDVSVSLSRDGEVVNQASMKDALGGPETAAQWMWQEAKSRGFRGGEDTTLLAGACGTVLPMEKGHYVADYGDLGSLEFTVE
ncbi:MAG: hypothetical protein MRY72_11345 [Aquisalinus sp.]|nr:hypothetical protein [Aquisalinus sp.]